MPRTWDCIVTTSPTAAGIHQRASSVRWRLPGAGQRHGPTTGRSGSGSRCSSTPSIALAEAAISRPAARPASGPPIDRASHQVDRRPQDPSPLRSRRPRPAGRRSSPGERGEQVVVDGAVMEVRRSRPAARASGTDAVGPAATGRACRGPGPRPSRRGRQARQAQERRDREQAEQDDQVRPAQRDRRRLLVGRRSARPVPRHGGFGRLGGLRARARPRPGAGQVHRLGRQDGQRPALGEIAGPARR